MAVGRVRSSSGSRGQYKRQEPSEESRNRPMRTLLDAGRGDLAVRDLHEGGWSQLLPVRRVHRVLQGRNRLRMLPVRTDVRQAA